MKTIQTLKVPGFVAGGWACGLKKKGVPDLTLIVSETPAVAAGVFTLNRVVSPTVTLTRQTVKSAKTIRAIVVNSGNANACTGPKGMKDCQSITVAVGQALGASAKEILSALCKVLLSIATLLVRNASMVAMLGWIMPDPLAMPPMKELCKGRSRWRWTGLLPAHRFSPASCC